MNCQFCKGKSIFNAEELDAERLLRILEEINARLKNNRIKSTTVLIDNWQFTFIKKNLKDEEN